MVFSRNKFATSHQTPHATASNKSSRGGIPRSEREIKDKLHELIERMNLTDEPTTESRATDSLTPSTTTCGVSGVPYIGAYLNAPRNQPAPTHQGPFELLPRSTRSTARPPSPIYSRVWGEPPENSIGVTTPQFVTYNTLTGVAYSDNTTEGNLVEGDIRGGWMLTCKHENTNGWQRLVDLEKLPRERYENPKFTEDTEGLPVRSTRRGGDPSELGKIQGDWIVESQDRAYNYWRKHEPIERSGTLNKGSITSRGGTRKLIYPIETGIIPDKLFHANSGLEGSKITNLTGWPLNTLNEYGEMLTYVDLKGNKERWEKIGDYWHNDERDTANRASYGLPLPPFSRSERPAANMGSSDNKPPFTIHDPITNNFTHPYSMRVSGPSNPIPAQPGHEEWILEGIDQDGFMQRRSRAPVYNSNSITQSSDFKPAHPSFSQRFGGNCYYDDVGANYR
ncbi:uncharacterized protein L201_000402 [Kwoniella dendrophila CBS 6074]|uniref:Uncharacterized protein n=1 Tax=Kwoniella dendrophila CBS 6074 TaxID=1295534 RepID=A0AAX4JKY8_9TREE